MHVKMQYVHAILIVVTLHGTSLAVVMNKKLAVLKITTFLMDVQLRFFVVNLKN